MSESSPTASETSDFSSPVMRPAAPPTVQEPVQSEFITASPPGWLDEHFGLIVSLTLHAALAIIVAFVILLLDRSADRPAVQIIVPSSFSDPAYSEHPGMASAGAADPSRDAQERLRQAVKNDGWVASTVTLDPSKMGKAGDVSWGPANGKTPLAGDSGSAGLAQYGTPAGGAAGPKSSFDGTGGNATRIVYVIDHTGSMVDCFGMKGEIGPGTVKDEVQQSVSNLIPLQYFALIVFTGTRDGGVQSVGPASLLRATAENKRLVLNRLRDDVDAQGGETENEIIFVNAFRAAFDMKPQLIYFLTDGDMSSNVLEEIKKMNPDRAVKINAIMLTHNGPDALSAEDKERFERISGLSHANGGDSKLVALKN